MHYLKKKDLPNSKLNEILSNPFIEKELKLGIGTGRFLCKIASNYKNKFIVGVEYKPHSSSLAAAWVKFKELKNAIVINMEAYEFVNNYINDNTFQTIHIYFPTPYPESIGLPHRLIEPKFIQEAFRILKPLGSVRFVTDHKEYFEETMSFFDEKKWWRVEWQPISVQQQVGHLLGTPHEKIHRKENRTIYNIQLLCLKK